MFRSSHETIARTHPNGDPKIQRDVFVMKLKSWSLWEYVLESGDGEALFWVKRRHFSRRIDVYDDPGYSEPRFALYPARRFSVQAEFVLAEPDGQVRARLRRYGEFTPGKRGWIALDQDRSPVAFARGTPTVVALLSAWLPIGLLLRSPTEIELPDGVVVGRFEPVPQKMGRHRLVLDNDPGHRLDRHVALALAIMLPTNLDS